MARLKLDLPVEQFCYATHLTVRVTDINSANHLANDSMISMISEARARFLHEFASDDVEGSHARKATDRIRKALADRRQLLRC